MTLFHPVRSLTRRAPTAWQTLLAAALGLGAPALASAQQAAKNPVGQASAKAATKPLSTPARTTPAKGKRPAAKTVAEVEPPARELELPQAAADQISAAEQVYYGVYDCEFKQTVNIASNTKHFGYVDVKHGKADYLMKPVVSSTGAIRLEDVRGETLMVQIAAKSMLLNVKTAQRLVDDCISPKQRELIEAARAAKAAEAAGGTPAPTAGAPLLAAPVAASADAASQPK